MRLTCPACNREIPAQDIDLSGRAAKCAACNNIFSFAGQIPDQDSGSGARIPVGMPKNIRIENAPDGLTIIRSWFTPAVIFMTFFCLFWNGFMVMWFSITISQKIYAMALFGCIHGLVGLGLLYGVLAGYLNKTYVRIGFDSLEIRHKPIPWIGEKNIPKQKLKQLYSKEVWHHTKHGHSTTYSLVAVTDDAHSIELINGLATSEEALFLEQEIEKYLGIKDAQVRGEIQR